MENSLKNTQIRLSEVLTKALADKHAEEFTYEWEWETFFLPSQTIEIAGQPIHTEYNLYFDFGEEDLDELVKADFYEKVGRTENNEITLLRVTYRKIG